MTLERLQSILLGLFLVFLVACCAAVIYTYSRGEIEPASLRQLLLKLLAVYSVHLSVVIGGMFAVRAAAASATAPRFAWSAIALALAWNLLITARVGLFAFQNLDTVDSLVEYMDTVAASSAFLVLGVITFVFVKHP
jgi:hypothetical protein